MKKLFVCALIVLLAFQGFAQESTKPKDEEKKFTTGVTLFNDLWKGSYTNMTPRGLNQGVDGFVLYNIPMERTPLTFSVGAGVGVHNLYSNAFLVKDDSTGAYSFEKIPVSYKKNKLTVAYMDFPFEFRYKNSKGFKAALGMKFGFVIGSHTKFKGDDYLGTQSGTIKVKFNNVDNLEKWRYGLTAKLGYKVVELYCYYGLSKLFKKDKGPDLYPISLGISLRPF